MHTGAIRPDRLSDPTPETLTVLTEMYGNALCKGYACVNGGWVKQHDFPKGKWFKVSEIAVSDIDGLFVCLTNLSTDNTKAIIRAKPNAGAFQNIENDGQTRRKKAFFDATSRRFVCFDVDHVIAPGFDIRIEPENVVAWLIRNHFPEEFQDVKCVWQLSNSAGMKSGELVKVHLWFWLDRPLGFQDLKGWQALKGFPADPALFRDVQIHFIANPVLSGAPDPCCQRWGMLDGERDQIAVPEIDLSEAKAKAAERGETLGGMVAGRDVAEILSKMGDHVGGHGFHHVILSAQMKWARTVPPSRHAAEREALKAAIREAARAAPRRPGRTLKEVENDYLTDAKLDAGIDGALRRALAHEEKYEPLETISLAEGERRIDKFVRGFFKQALEGRETPPQSAVLVTPGCGKSETALRVSAENADYLRTHRLHLFCSDNDVAAEMTKRAKAILPHDVLVRHHKGREYNKKGAPLCHPSMHEKARIVEKCGKSVAKTLCPICPHFSNCEWPKQNQDDGPGLVIMAQSYAFTPRGGKCDIAIFDEEFVIGSCQSRTLAFSDFTAHHELPDLPENVRGWGKGSMARIYAQIDLRKARMKLWEASGNGTRVPTFAQLRQVGLTAELATLAKGIEYGRAEGLAEMVTAEIERGSTPEQIRQKLADAYKRFDQARRYARAWQTLEKQLALPDSPRATLNGWNLSDGVLQFAYRRDLKVKDIPVLALDATGDERLLKLCLPHLSEVERVVVDAPFAHVIQVVGTRNGKRALVDMEHDDDATKAAKSQRRRGLIQTAIASGQNPGFIAYKGVEESPEGEAEKGRVTSGHFGNLRGQNRWEKTDALVVAGRWLPRASALELIAGGLFYDQPEAVFSGAIQDGVGWHHMRDGTGLMGKGEYHPCPVVETVRNQITEAEQEQAVGRGRGVRRTEKDPVRIFVLTPTPMAGVVVDQVLERLPVNTLDTLFAETGVFLGNWRHVVKAFPDLFKTEAAAKKAFQRGPMGDISLIRSFTKANVPHWSHAANTWAAVRYQLAGERQKVSSAVFDTRIVADPRAWLDKKLGSLAKFETDTPATVTRLYVPANDNRICRHRINAKPETDVSAEWEHLDRTLRR